jgi:small-conductance mechanosensitive channel
MIGTLAFASMLVCEGGIAQQQPDQQQPSNQPADRPTESGAPLAVSQLSSESDRRLEEILDAAYGQIQALSEVQAAVDTGVVTLLGDVPRPRARENAEAIASKLEGVLFVNNQLEVVEPADGEGAEPAGPSVEDEAIQERLNIIFGHVEELAEVEASVEAGVVRLSGEVPGPEATRRAEEFAAQLDGVVYVDNDIQEAREFSRRLQPALDQLTELVEAAVVYFPLLFVALLILVVFWFVARTLTKVDFLFRRLSDRPLVQNIVRQLVSTVVFLGGVLLVLEVFDITALVGAVLGTAGVAGIALGFAFRDIGENYLASLFLSLRRPFNHNDQVRIEDFEGKVVRLTTRDTVLMTLDGNHVRVPNSRVFKSVIHNYTRNPRRRLAVTVGVSVDADLVEARHVGLDALDNMQGVLEEPRPFARVQRLAESNVEVAFFGWVNQSEYDFLNVQSEAMYIVKAALDAAGVEMPEPIYRVNLINPENQPVPKAPRTKPAEPAPASVVNLAADAEIDDQISEDRQHSDEPDLLEGK